VDSARRLLSAAPEAAAARLLGAHVESRIGGDLVRMRLTEVEAYGGVGEDPGSHAFRRRSGRNGAMFGAPGHAYVYFIYGMHHCLNVTIRPVGEAGAILLRAGEVVAGLEVARSRRPGAADQDLARGPARLCLVLGVTRVLDGVDMLGGSGAELRLQLAPAPAAVVETGPRTGVSGAGSATLWRFFLPNEATVSTFRPAVPRKPRSTG
jgi:DNA-3-methyladenine glycosylase